METEIKTDDFTDIFWINNLIKLSRLEKPKDKINNFFDEIIDSNIDYNLIKKIVFKKWIFLTLFMKQKLHFLHLNFCFQSLFLPFNFICFHLHLGQFFFA